VYRAANSLLGDLGSRVMGDTMDTMANGTVGDALAPDRLGGGEDTGGEGGEDGGGEGKDRGGAMGGGGGGGGGGGEGQGSQQHMKKTGEERREKREGKRGERGEMRGKGGRKTAAGRWRDLRDGFKFKYPLRLWTRHMGNTTVRRYSVLASTLYLRLWTRHMGNTTVRRYSALICFS
jgi:hypothetical protein